MVQPLQKPEQRLGNHRQPAVIDSEIKPRRQRGQFVLFLRARVQGHDQARFAAGSILPIDMMTPAE